LTVFEFKIAKELKMNKEKKIGLVAHDARKQDMLDWVRYNAAKLSPHKMICTGTTGQLLIDMFADEFPSLCAHISRLRSGPLGGDQQMGALITEGALDMLIFFTDPMTTQPHDVDVKALVRLCTVYNTIIACNRATADFVISSPLFDEEYEPVLHDYTSYLVREALEMAPKNPR
jgi:methylglyoxal synthase